MPLVKTLHKNIPTLITYGGLALAGLTSSGVLQTPLGKLVAKLAIFGVITTIVINKTSKIILPIKLPSKNLLFINKDDFIEQQLTLLNSSFYIDGDFKVYFGGIEELSLNQVDIDSLLLETTQLELLNLLGFQEGLLISDIITRITLTE